jgi:pyruvate dehydrogenase E2 component (dihydrolipoamide acetyltransferase)
MAEVILMPRLSDTMTEGVIAAWHKNIGDPVKKGDVLAEIETDKATMELESYKDGTLLHIGADQGSKLQVNDLLAIVGQKGEDISGLLKGGGAKDQKPQAASDKPQAASEKPQAASDKPQAASDKPQAEQATASQQPASTETSADKQETITEDQQENGRVKASPLAKRLAAEKGIDLKRVQGTGDGGRITKEDIDNYKESGVGSQQPAVSSRQPEAETQREKPQQKEAPKYIPSAPVGKESFDEVPVSQMRKVIAKRLAESKFTAPHFYLTMSIDMDKAVASRDKLNEVSPVKISFNDFVVKACAVALKQHPAVNSSWMGDKIRRNHHVHIGVAVAVEDGLLVPVVRFADGKSLSQIAAEVKNFAQKAKEKKLQPSDWEGNTFTISNLGMFGIEDFTGIINTPDACLLAVGAIQQVPVVRNGEIKIGHVMKLTMSCDHRVVDGATGSAFLQTLKGLLEEPLRMLV